MLTTILEGGFFVEFGRLRVSQVKTGTGRKTFDCRPKIVRGPTGRGKGVYPAGGGRNQVS
jgi:hypothetical protein